jgi:5-methyltetrahydropteroyltriglutamate--homocysteine methyltransferase
MKRSTDRILTTHVGSLPRPDDLIDLLQAKDRGNLTDEASRALEARSAQAVRDIVQKQRDIGIDVVSDGEQSKPDYSTYIKDRFTGFDGPPSEAMDISRDRSEFPDYTAGNRQGGGAATVGRPTCNGPIAWRDFAAVQKDIDNLKHALSQVEGAVAGDSEVFMTSVSPGQAARFLRNEGTYYKNDEEYLHALGAVLKEEYEAIANAGFILQLDCPDLGSGWNNWFRHLTLPEFKKRVDMHLEVLDEATKNIAPEHMRLHLCWGNYSGPHNHDIPLAEIIGPVLKSRSQGISFEGANPRHEHEWTVFRETKLPDGKVVIPGVIDSTTNFVEHPEVVAQRIERYAEVVGRENVIAGADCGFATFARQPTVFPLVTWAKLASLVEGARIASERLWAR